MQSPTHDLSELILDAEPCATHELAHQQLRAVDDERVVELVLVQLTREITTVLPPAQLENVFVLDQRIATGLQYPLGRLAAEGQDSW